MRHRFLFDCDGLAYLIPDALEDAFLDWSDRAFDLTDEEIWHELDMFEDYIVDDITAYSFEDPRPDSE